MTVNRLLTDKDRELLKPLIDDMFRVCPHTMNRKIARANVQQAFVLSTVLNAIKQIKGVPNILSVGCYDDTAYEYLMSVPNKIDIIGIDPEINVSLHSFRTINHDEFDIIFSTSVIEHVKDDLEFLDDICKLLAPNGIGVLTMDFNDSYKLGDSLPATDLRFYTKQDLEVGFNFILEKNGCSLVDTPDWNGEPEFTHDGCKYSFATYVFRKN